MAPCLIIQPSFTPSGYNANDYFANTTAKVTTGSLHWANRIIVGLVNMLTMLVIS